MVAQTVDGIAAKNTLAGCPTIRKGAHMGWHRTELIADDLDEDVALIRMYMEERQDQ